MKHPHLSRRHIMIAYRQYILGCKKRFGSARGLIHYIELIQEYLSAKRDVLAGRE